MQTKNPRPKPWANIETVDTGQETGANARLIEQIELIELIERQPLKPLKPQKPLKPFKLKRQII